MPLSAVAGHCPTCSSAVTFEDNGEGTLRGQCLRCNALHTRAAVGENKRVGGSLDAVLEPRPTHTPLQDFEPNLDLEQEPELEWSAPIETPPEPTEEVPAVTPAPGGEPKASVEAEPEETAPVETEAADGEA